MAISIPTPLKVEHEELHAELVALTKAPGKVGRPRDESRPSCTRTSSRRKSTRFRRSGC